MPDRTSRDQRGLRAVLTRLGYPTGVEEWGVTILEAAAEFDTGSIWASHTFPVAAPAAAKSSLYRHEVTEAAVRGVVEAIAKFEAREFQPEPLDYTKPDVLECLRPPMRQAGRSIDWSSDSTETIARKIRAADGAPRVLDIIYGKDYFLIGYAPYSPRYEGVIYCYVGLRTGWRRGLPANV